MDQIVIEAIDDAPTKFSFYCVNDVPPGFEGEGYALKFRITLKGEAEWTGRIGDCHIVNYNLKSLAYIPGLIPFSNSQPEPSPMVDSWRGCPYPGYQYPFIWSIDRTPDEFKEYLNEMVDFLYDSQQWYYEKFGVLGPGASAYIWNRWDTLAYGPADTWTMYHFGTDDA